MRLPKVAGVGMPSALGGRRGASSETAGAPRRGGGVAFGGVQRGGQQGGQHEQDGNHAGQCRQGA
ncbi:hypothetical protein ACLQ8Z_14215 [Bordetella hinzii]|uniref:hypothetical protein n=1 Tax=Bordetella hinzii TaxID=103855 RepID=UPI000518E584|nr:hypothetical protein [Bordetella hinzii]